MAANLDQRRAFRYPEWKERYELVATVTSAIHCANFIEKDQTYVFSLDGILDPDKSTANLCLGMLARLQPALLMAADRATLGAHPVSSGWQTFDCYDTGLDHGGMGKVCVRLSLRDRASGEPVADAVAEEEVNR